MMHGNPNIKGQLILKRGTDKFFSEESVTTILRRVRSLKSKALIYTEG